MQSVNIVCTAGPMRGFDEEFVLGELVIGRQPEMPGLVLKGAGSSVSRRHLKLEEKDGMVAVSNLSPNGTVVNGKLIVDDIQIRTGAKIEIGDQFILELRWESFGAETVVKKKATSAPVAKQGPLASPVVRAVLGVYLLGMVALAVWFGLADDQSTVAADEWPAVEAAYQLYEPNNLSDDERQGRLERAKSLIGQIRIRRTQGDTRDIDRICREIMSLDGDTKSPLFQYGVNCLAVQ